MTKQRLEILIKNILCEIEDKIDMDRETYISWLKTEIGMTEEEIKHLGI